MKPEDLKQLMSPENAAEHTPGATIIICGYRHYEHNENLRKPDFK